MELLEDLERKVRLAAERIQHLVAVRLELEQQVSTLRDEQRGLQARVDELEAGRAEVSSEARELTRLREERSEIKTRVEKLITELAGLELEEKRPVKTRSRTGTARKKAASSPSAAAGS